HIKRVQEEGNERASRERSIQNEAATLPEHGDDGAETAEGENAKESPTNFGAAHRRGDHVAEMRSISPHFLRFGNSILHSGARASESTPEQERRSDDDGHDGERRRRQRRMRERKQHDPA